MSTKILRIPSLYLAAESLGCCYIMSSHANTEIPDVAKVSNGLKWMQLYIYENRDAVRTLAKRAEDGGYKAVVVTVDTSGTAYSRLPVKGDPSILHAHKNVELEICGALVVGFKTEKYIIY